MNFFFKYIKNISDRRLNYGRSIITNFAQIINYKPKNVLDIGCGMGFDLQNIKKIFPNIDLYGIDNDFGDKIEFLKENENGIRVLNCDIEENNIAFNDEKFDIVISNQTIEHCKNIHHIISECVRVLKINGILIIGVPNLASLHNRLALLFGIQPPSIKLDSGHVRGFTTNELINFIIKISDNSLKLINLKGSNFYPLPPLMSKSLSKLFPKLSVSVFLAFRKTKNYEQQYINQLKLKPYETKYKF